MIEKTAGNAQLKSACKLLFLQLLVLLSLLSEKPFFHCYHNIKELSLLLQWNAQREEFAFSGSYLVFAGMSNYWLDTYFFQNVKIILFPPRNTWSATAWVWLLWVFVYMCVKMLVYFRHFDRIAWFKCINCDSYAGRETVILKIPS